MRENKKLNAKNNLLILNLCLKYIKTNLKNTFYGKLKIYKKIAKTIQKKINNQIKIIYSKNRLIILSIYFCHDFYVRLG